MRKMRKRFDMNDFTKEELECLLSNHWSCGANYEGLYNKIQFLIDNYCEHEYMVFLAEQNNEPFILKCSKCHELRFSDE